MMVSVTMWTLTNLKILALDLASMEDVKMRQEFEFAGMKCDGLALALEKLMLRFDLKALVFGLLMPEFDFAGLEFKKLILN